MLSSKLRVGNNVNSRVLESAIMFSRFQSWQ